MGVVDSGIELVGRCVSEGVIEGRVSVLTLVNVGGVNVALGVRVDVGLNVGDGVIDGGVRVDGCVPDNEELVVLDCDTPTLLSSNNTILLTTST